ncbi:MAG TPA: hypothetical protein VGO41_06820 [Steroidobacteraceae bacterium]|jgi:hypothetical protein|nr:hypothetical protein [Steroidobacteraceae bacterium]
MKRLCKYPLAGSGLLFMASLVCAADQASATKPVAQESKATAAAMKECVAREQAKSNTGKEEATLACREQREALRLKETGAHSSSEVTVNSPPAPANKMSASGHSSHSATSGAEPSTSIQESKNSAPEKPQ